MAHIRFTDLATRRVDKLQAKDYRQAKRLFGYSVRVATTDTLIELVSENVVLHRHEVVFTDRVPTMQGMSRTR